MSRLSLRPLVEFTRRAAAGAVAAPPLPGTSLMAYVNRLDDEVATLHRAAELVPVVYGCIDRIASSLAQLPLQFLLRDKLIEEPVAGQPGWLFEFVNPVDTGYDMREQLFTSLLMNGNAYLFLDYMGGKPGVDPPTECRVIPGHVVVPKEDEFIVVSEDGKEWHIPRWQMLHFRLWSPKGEMRGWSPLQTAMLAAKVNREAQRYLDRIYQSGGLVSGFITTSDDGGLMPQEREAVLKDLEAQQRTGRPVALPRGLKWEQMGLTNEQMQFLETSGWTDQQLCLVYRLPPIILGIKESGGLSAADSSSSDMLLYWGMCLKPHTEKFLGVVNQNLLRDVRHRAEFGMGWRAQFDFSRVPELMDAWLKRAEAVAKLVGRPPMAVNEGREILELEPDADPESDMLHKPPAPGSFGAEDDSEDEKGRGRPSGKSAWMARADMEVGESPAGPPPAAAPMDLETLRARNDRRLSRREPVAKRGFRRLLRQQEKRVIAGLGRAAAMRGTRQDANGNGAMVVWAAIDVEQLLRETESDKAIVRRFLRAIIAAAAGEAVDDLEEKGLTVSFRIGAESVRRWLAERAEIMVVGTTKTTRDQLRDSLAEGVRENETHAELVARVREVFSERYAGQAETVARTETVSAWNFANTEVWKQSDGVVEAKMWITSRDDRVRGTSDKDEFSHKDADGQIVPLDALFEVSGEELEFPGDHAHGASPGNLINCRCTSAPVVDEVRAMLRRSRDRGMLLETLLKR